MLSHALWRRRFGGDSSVVGRALSLNGDPHTVVGVMPPPHQYPNEAQLWVPLQLDPTRSRGNQYLDAVGRLKAGASLAMAQAEIASIADRLAQQYAESNAGWTASVVPWREHEVVGEYKPVLAIMMGAVAFVLLIACANVANLLLARATARRREIAIRAALGAGRWRIVRQLLTESVLLALGGAAVGLLIALWGLDLIVATVPSDKPFWMVFTIDGRVLAFTLAVAVGTGVLFGLAPAYQATRTTLHESLKEGTRGAGESGPRHRLRSGLVVVEVALSLVLLIGATLMIRSFLSLQRVDPGFDRHNVLALDVFLTGAAYDSAYERTAFYRELMPRLAALPGVLNATASHAPPLSGSSWNSSITIEGQAVQHGEEPRARLQSVTAGFITALRVPLLLGRDIEESDLKGEGLVAVINQTMAERFWPGQVALGRRFRFGNSGDEWLTVVGVAADLKQHSLSELRQNQVYVPYAHSPYRGMTLLLRTSADPTGVVALARDAVRRVDPLLPVSDVQTMEAMYRFSTWEQRLYGGMFGSFAAIALLLASVGLYGVMAYMVTLRTHEIGVRMALGAERRHVLGLVVRRGLTLTGIGLAIGLVGAFALTRVLSNLLFGVTTTDPPSFLGIPAMLAAVALLASWVPARRAARVDPMLALRYE